MQVIELLLSDYKKYKKYGGNFISILFFTQGFWAVLQYRLAHSVYKMKVPLVKQVLQIICLKRILFVLLFLNLNYLSFFH